MFVASHCDGDTAVAAKFACWKNQIGFGMELVLNGIICCFAKLWDYGWFIFIRICDFYFFV